MTSKNNRINYFKELRAKLSFDDGFAESPIYSIKGMTTEKNKGINMLELIEDHFKISKEDRKKAFVAKMSEINALAIQPTEQPKGFKHKKIEWTRDEKGEIISPFKSKNKDL
jgi:hypothetical protein